MAQPNFDDLIEGIVPGYRNRMARLEQELKDAEWILEYEKRLISLQKKSAAQRSRTEQAGADTERLRRLEHHLAGLRRRLSLD